MELIVKENNKSPKILTLVEYDYPLKTSIRNIGEPRRAAFEDVGIDSVVWVRTPQCEEHSIDLRIKIEQKTASDEFVGRVFDEEHYVKDNKLVYPGECYEFQIEGVKLGDTIRLSRKNARVIEV
jgi:hypothetical protein